MGPILEGSRGSRPRKFLEKKLRLQLNNLTQKLDFDFCGLEEEEYTRFEKKRKKNRKKGKKKEKLGKKGKRRKKPHRGQKWVGWDERVS